jgi:5-bromo-4-chloroindolyl phosphate hydrolysis protein
MVSDDGALYYIYTFLNSSSSNHEIIKQNISETGLIIASLGKRIVQNRKPICWAPVPSSMTWKATALKSPN